MRTRVLLATCLAATLGISVSLAAPLGTAFTYQGRLNDGANPANGHYDFTFSAFDAASGGTQQGSTVSVANIPVSNGLFSASLDFGSIFDGNARWLAVSVRTNGAGGYSALSPRQPLTPSPYALYTPNAGAALAATTASTATTAATATTANGVANNAVTAAGIAPGQIVKSLNSLHDSVTLAAGANATVTPSGQTLTVSTPTDWHIGGNAGISPGANFIGTTDNQPLELKVGGVRVMRYEQSVDGFNTIGGDFANTMAPGVVGSTIAGGGNTNGSAGNYGPNSISANYSTVGGGAANLIESGAFNSVIGGGAGNDIGNAAFRSTVAGGQFNNVGANANDATIGGGFQNAAGGVGSTVGGGSGNKIEAAADRVVIAGGSNNVVRGGAVLATISGGQDNQIGSNVLHSVIAGGTGNQVLGASNTTFAARDAFIGGGGANVIEPYGYNSAILGGSANRIQYDGDVAVIAGGGQNLIGTNADFSMIGGGFFNVIANGAQYAAIPGGFQNAVGQSYALAAGSRAKANHVGTFVWADSQGVDFTSSGNNQFLIRAAGNVGINKTNPATALDVNGTVTATGFAGSGLGLTGVAQLGANQTFTGTTLFNPASGSPFQVGNSTLVPNLNADLLDGLSATAFWKLTGNSGTSPSLNFVGTTDNQPLEFRVNNTRALRLEPVGGTANVIGGFSGNSITGGAQGATIGGGGVSGNANSASGSYATIAGGVGNVASGPGAVIAGGGYDGATIVPNQASGPGAAIGGGTQNTASGSRSAVGGGHANLATNWYATVPGGWFNTAGGFNSFAAGHRAKALHDGSFVWADNSPADFASSANNQFLIRASGNVGINTGNPATALDVNGTVTATRFNGSGAGLTGIPAGSLPGNLAYLTADETFTGWQNFNNGVSFNNNAFLNEHELCLRSGDINHGLGWYGAGKLFAGYNVDGPVLYGWSGGGLGTTSGGQALALHWDTAGNVAVDPNGLNNGSITPGLTFGSSSGEGISSKRTTGGNQFGLDFYTGFSTRMSLTQSGRVGIGVTAPVAQLDVRDGTGTLGNGGHIHVGANVSGTDPKLINFGDGDYVHIGEIGGDDVMEIQAMVTCFTNIDGVGRVGMFRYPTANRLELAGNASKDTAGGWLANSDARIKKDVQSVKGALEKIDRVRLVQFQYTDEYLNQHPSIENHPYLNVVAQEFQQVFPDWVQSSGEKLANGEEILQVDTYPLVIYSAAAVQELHQQLKAKDAEIQSLKQRIDAIENMLKQTSAK